MVGLTPETSDQTSRAASVMTTAVIRAADIMDLSGVVLSRTLGVSSAQVSRMRQGKAALNPNGKDFECAALLVRLFRGLDAITGGDDDTTKSWMASPNTPLQGRPIDLIQTVTGLTRTVAYVDSRRAKI